MKFSEFIKKTRGTNNWSLQQLRDQLLVMGFQTLPQTIMKWERGLTPNVGAIMPLSKLTGKTPEEILGMILEEHK